MFNFIRSIKIPTLYRTFSAVLRNGLRNDLNRADHADAREWLKNYNINTIPRRLCDVSFSRSSGPGGQNVNKVNSKATLRIHFEDLLPLVPKILHDEIRASQYCAGGSNSLVVQADSYRKQSDNVTACFGKLHNLFITAAKACIKGETSPEQVAKVKRLQKAENEARLRSKKHHSSKKGARRSGGLSGQ